MPMPAGEIAGFLRGIGIGVAVAAPVGPMSVLCMRRTLTGGYAFGLGTGIGIAAGDAAYALVAALGLSGVMRFMLAHERPLHALAGAFLLYLGGRGVRQRLRAHAHEPADDRLVRRHLHGVRAGGLHGRAGCCDGCRGVRRIAAVVGARGGPGQPRAPRLGPTSPALDRPAFWARAGRARRRRTAPSALSAGLAGFRSTPGRKLRS